MSAEPPVDFAARRWAAAERSDAHSPRAMLVEMIRQIDAGEIDPGHVIAVYGTRHEDRNAIETGWLQAGDMTVLEQRGLLTGVVMHMHAGGWIR